MAGEWGHIPLPWPSHAEIPGRNAGAGSPAAWRRFICGPALAMDCDGPDAHDASGIPARAAAGEQKAIDALARHADRMGRSLSVIVNLLDPDIIVLGGGLSNMEHLYTELPKVMMKHVFSDFVSTPVVKNKHGDSSGVRGAAWMWPPPVRDGPTAPVAALCRDCGADPGEARTCPAVAAAASCAMPNCSSLHIAHVDCDAFYASVEKRDRPELAARPVIVGGGVRGVVTAACYVARIYGVRSAMPMFKALKACPDAVVIKPDFAKYVAASRQIRALMAGLTPLVQPLSIDEAVLDMAGTEALHRAPPAAVLARFALAVEREVGVTVSIGLRPTGCWPSLLPGGTSRAASA